MLLLSPVSVMVANVEVELSGVGEAGPGVCPVLALRSS